MRAPVLALIFVCLAACGPQAGGDAPRDDEPLSIGQVQGTGEASPLLGRSVAVEGVVTGNFVSGIGGFFLQSALGAEDTDPETSEGLFVSYPRGQEPRPRRGDRVLVHGTVAEFGPSDSSLTAIDDTSLQVLGRGQARSEVLSQAPADGRWERYEGMQVEIGVPLTLSGNAGLLRFGELLASFDGRLRQPTDAHPPGDAARRLEADNSRRQLILDDARGGEYPRELWFLPEPLSPTAPLRAGSRLHGVRGVLDQRHGQYRLQLTQRIDRVEQAPRPPAPAPPSGVRIASLNLLNLFNGDGRGGGFPTARGASDMVELERQRAKHVATLVALDPDIAALMEVENDGFEARSSLARLVEELNAQLGEAGDYRFVDAGQGPGGDEIRVALIYRAGRVQPVGRPQTLETGAFAARNRPPLLQGFRAHRGGPAFAVAALHLKSKGGCEEADDANRDRGDGQSCWNAARVDAARELGAWALGDPAGLGTAHVLLLGDFNAYGQEDPLRLLRAGGWHDGTASDDDAPHSFVFQGRAGRLDHALASPGLAPFLRETLHWNSNADESEAFSYARARRQPQWYRPDAYRASDHDPLLVALDFDRSDATGAP